MLEKKLGDDSVCLKMVLNKVSFTYFFQTPFGKAGESESWIICHSYKSKHRRCSIKTGAVKSFTKFTGKHLCQSIFFNKVAGLRLLLFIIEATQIIVVYVIIWINLNNLK